MSSAIDTSQVDLIRSSMRQILPRAEELGTTFYDELFRRAPELREAFPENMGEQRAKLVATLAVAVKHLDDLPQIEEELQRLGRMHGALGADESAYALVGEVLVDVLDEMTQMDDPTRSAWVDVYRTLSSVMFAAGSAQPAPSA